MNAVRCTFGSEEKNPQGKHKKYYAGHFDSSDVEETMYLVIAEIFYAIPDGDGCIEIDNVKSKIPINNASSLMKNISFFLAALCNFHGAKIEKEVSENVKTNDSEKEIVLTDYKPSQKLWQVVRGKVSRRMECAEILRLLQKDMYGIFELFKSDSISIRAAVKTVIEKPQTFVEMKEAEGLELLQQEELCNMILDYTGVKIQKTNVSMIFSTVRKRLMDHIYLCTEKHKSFYSLDTWNVIMLCLSGDCSSFKRQIELHEDFLYWWESVHHGNVNDDICKTTTAFKDLDNFDPASIFEETATGVHLNTEALKEYNEELELQTKNNFAEAIADKQKEINEAQANNKSQDVINGLQSELQSLKLLANEYDGMTSSYNKFVNATSSANERDSFENVAKSYDSIGKLIQEGWVTDDSVTSYLDLLLGTDRIQDSIDAYAQLDKTIEGTSHSLKDYMTFDEDGNFTSKGAWDFMDDVASKLGDDFVKIGEDGTYAFDLTGDKIQQVADAFGTTTDFVELLGKALADSDVQVKFDSSDVQNYNEQLKQLQETSTATQDKLKELQSSTSGESGGGLLSGIDLDYDKASMSIDQLDSKISELTGKREEISVSANTEEGQQAISALDSEIESLQSQKIMLSIGAQLEGGATVDQLLGISIRKKCCESVRNLQKIRITRNSLIVKMSW